jgi:hypothetical protein
MSQFEVAQGLMDSASPAAKIVNEELDKFFESSKKRLQELDEHEGFDDGDSTGKRFETSSPSGLVTTWPRNLCQHIVKEAVGMRS